MIFRGVLRDAETLPARTKPPSVLTNLNWEADVKCLGKRIMITLSLEFVMITKLCSGVGYA